MSVYKSGPLDNFFKKMVHELKMVENHRFSAEVCFEPLL